MTAGPGSVVAYAGFTDSGEVADFAGVIVSATAAHARVLLLDLTTGAVCGLDDRVSLCMVDPVPVSDPVAVTVSVLRRLGVIS